MKDFGNNKLAYYVKGYYNLLSSYFNKKDIFHRHLRNIENYDKQYLIERVNYYNRLSEIKHIKSFDSLLKNLKKPLKPSAYFFDTIEYTNFFDTNLGINFLFGDIITVPSKPTLVKTRPVKGQNENSILLKLDKLRHFRYIQDTIDFNTKKNILFGRAGVYQKHRINFYNKYFNHPLCDLGQVNKSGGNPEWIKKKMSLQEHLKYKFILSLEGNDVATNLKWIMSSNSVAVMPLPKYESWFMEGKLIPDYHFISINDDYSDLEYKINFYISNPEKTIEIIKNANEYVKQFQNKKLESLISILVLEKYFYYTGQSSLRTLEY